MNLQAPSVGPGRKRPPTDGSGRKLHEGVSRRHKHKGLAFAREYRKLRRGGNSSNSQGKGKKGTS